MFANSMPPGSHAKVRAHGPLLARTDIDQAFYSLGGPFFKRNSWLLSRSTVPHAVKPPLDGHDSVRIDHYSLRASNTACYALFMPG